MQFERLDAGGDVLQAKSVGRIVPEGGDRDGAILTQLFGPEVFARQVALDLSESDFISSSGIGWLLQMHKHFQRAGGRLTIQRLSREVDRMLRMMRLEAVLNLP